MNLPTVIKNVTLSFIFFLFIPTADVFAQDGKIIERKPFIISDSVTAILNKSNPDLVSKLHTLNFFQATYLSNGLKVTAYIVEPKEKGKYPCIISNRGGNGAFGQWNPMSITFFLARMANWGYVVVATQYRGNDGGEGKEEFGGQEISDVLNLIPVLSQLPSADTSRIGIEGSSRGGMMTYLALKESSRFKAAVVTAGLANAFTNIAKRPEMEQGVFSKLVPDYWANKDEQLRKRSAVYWADKMCKTTPLLIMHGSSDWRVSPSESLELVAKLFEYKHPTRFILFEGADHGIREFRDESFAETKRHFDYYLRDLKKFPSMEPHGR
jgi:dipeptidyl aminopeptidase/acylaminoacyl peptidase